MPVCAQLLQAAVDAGEIRADVTAYEFMRGIGALCAGVDAGASADADASDGTSYDARRLVGLLVAGLLRPVQKAAP